MPNDSTNLHVHYTSNKPLYQIVLSDKTIYHKHEEKIKSDCLVR